MPGSFDDVQTIVVHKGHNKSHKCLSPEGPLGAPGETVERLDIWVFQKGARDPNSDEVAAACVAFLERPFTGDRWKANPDPEKDHFGEGFEPGPATGIGLMVRKDKEGKTIVEQWEKKLELK